MPDMFKFNMKST